MEIDQRFLYSANAEKYTLDEVDICIQELQRIQEYEEVCNYVEKKFGTIEKQKIIEYPELDKQVEIVIKEDAIEFFAAKNWNQYFGRGWRIIKEEEAKQESK